MSKRRDISKLVKGRLSSSHLSLRITARKRSILDYQQIREEVVTLSKIPLLLKEARRQKQSLLENNLI